MDGLFDLIDTLIDALNDGVEDVTFERDVLDTNRPEDWAAVELTGDDGDEWADGHLIDQSLMIDVWVCVSDRGSGVKRQVQTVLNGFCDEMHIGWKLVSRNWLYDLNKVMWRWQVSIDGPLAKPQAEDHPEDEDPEGGG